MRSSLAPIFVSAPKHPSVVSMWNSWKAFVSFLFPPPVSLCHTAVVTDVTCLFGCGMELPAAICIRPAAVPASVLRPALTYSWIRRLWQPPNWQPPNWLRSPRSQKGRAFEVVLEAWRCTGVILADRRSQPVGPAVRESQEPSGGDGPTDSTADIGRWSSAPCGRTADGLRNSDGDLASFKRAKCGSVRAMCCDAVRDHMWYYAEYLLE